MANFSGASQGYLNYDQANQQKQLQQAQLQAYMQRIAQQNQAMQTEQRMRAARAGAGADWMAQQLAPPPQDPGQPPAQPPGQSSAGGTPNGGPPPQQPQQIPQPPQGPAAQAMQMGGNPGAPIGPPPGAGAPPGGPPQQGPGPGGPPAAANPSWQPMPTAPPGGGAGAPAPGGPGQLSAPPAPAADTTKTDSGAVPFHNQELAAYAKSWKQQGLNGEQIMDRLEVLAPMMNAEQKQQLAQMKQMLDIQKQTNAYQEKLIADARADKSLALREKEVTSLDANRKEMRDQGNQRIAIAKQRLNAQVASAAGGKQNLKSTEFIYPKGEDGKPDQSQPPIGTRGVTKSGKIIQMDIDGNTITPGSAKGGTAKEGAAQASGKQKSITNLKEDRRVLIAAGTPLTDPRVKSLDDKITAMEKGGGDGGAKKHNVGDAVTVNGKPYKVTGFDKDGEPLVVPAQ